MVYRVTQILNLTKLFAQDTWMQQLFSNWSGAMGNTFPAVNGISALWKSWVAQKIIKILFISLFFVGMLSKSKGPILRVATALHIFFHVGSFDWISDQITEEAIAASVNFVGLCCQQTAYMAGRGDIKKTSRLSKQVCSLFIKLAKLFSLIYVQLHKYVQT